MKLEDLTIKKLKKFISSKELSPEGNKKELCETIFNYIEQQVIQEIQLCWNEKFQSEEEQMMDVTGGLEKGITCFIKSQTDEKLEVLKSYDDLKNKKQKLQERIEQQKQTVSNLPNIIRFTTGQDVSISKSLIAKCPNSILYTLISSNQFQPSENTYYLNFGETTMKQVLNFIRNKKIPNSKLNKEWGCLDTQYSNELCLPVEDILFVVPKDVIKYGKFKQFIEKEIEKQSDMLDLNFEQYDNQIKQLTELIYDDPIHLNVSGKIFTISKSKLEKHENTYFYPLVSGNWTLENNTHFIDRCYDHFDIIYEYLVSNKTGVYLENYYRSLRQEEEQNIFTKEIDYYQLDPILIYLIYGFHQSGLKRENREYMQTLYPGKWKLIPKEEITDTINKTTVIVWRHSRGVFTGYYSYSKLTENHIDLSKGQTLVFDCLDEKKRGETESHLVPEYTKLAKPESKYEIYEKKL